VIANAERIRKRIWDGQRLLGLVRKRKRHPACIQCTDGR